MYFSFTIKNEIIIINIKNIFILFILLIINKHHDEEIYHYRRKARFNFSVGFFWFECLYAVSI